jgi:hypothetical protein
MSAGAKKCQSIFGDLRFAIYDLRAVEAHSGVVDGWVELSKAWGAGLFRVGRACGRACRELPQAGKVPGQHVNDVAADRIVCAAGGVWGMAPATTAGSPSLAYIRRTPIQYLSDSYPTPIRHLAKVRRMRENHAFGGGSERSGATDLTARLLTAWRGPRYAGSPAGRARGSPPGLGRKA